MNTRISLTNTEAQTFGMACTTKSFIILAIESYKIHKVQTAYQQGKEVLFKDSEQWMRPSTHPAAYIWTPVCQQGHIPNSLIQ